MITIKWLKKAFISVWWKNHFAPIYSTDFASGGSRGRGAMTPNENVLKLTCKTEVRELDGLAPPISCDVVIVVLKHKNIWQKDKYIGKNAEKMC